MKAAIIRTIILASSVAISAAGCSKVSNMNGMDHSKMNMGSNSTSNSSESAASVKLTTATPVVNGKEFTITAQESNLEVKKGKTIPVWTFNNSVPGPQVRVMVGDTVKINLKNQLKQPVSIHWHGYPVPNNMDGIPGVTQDAVEPGKTFTYEFKATIPGTYWYHSHQDSVNQVDKGLYGSLIVEDPQDTADRDYTLVLDEWMSSGDMNMDNGGMNMAGHDMSMYDLYTINGKTGDAIDKLTVKEGEKVKLRLINAGYITHRMHLHGHSFKVVASDGQPVNDPAVIKDQFVSIAPGERYDIEFTADHPGTWLLEEHAKDNRAQNMRAIIQYEGSNSKPDPSNASEELPDFDLEKYGTMSASAFSLDQTFDEDVTMYLNTEMRNGEMVYTINGKIFPETDTIKVKRGPMHLHGHFFQVLSKNGKPVQGSPIMKDTLNVKPGETYEVAFEADNPGEWMFHCHDLHHASAGMVTDVMYDDYQNNYTPDPTVNNVPE
ncbi:multicopper oxidase family protein [Paenibacillus sp. AR247]|uniref:multicopper oxidase family protein n=1 Tax=Paenibacillus sp. AR247 TaxID=1631599 RepID=UPI000CF8EAB9|nr:multicopper oxidase family protein [Paenibacillus sp. AR247]PQP89968.1 copper oxidase [Paenibacillus sp. AR247]